MLLQSSSSVPCEIYVESQTWFVKCYHTGSHKSQVSRTWFVFWGRSTITIHLSRARHSFPVLNSVWEWCIDVPPMHYDVATVHFCFQHRPKILFSLELTRLLWQSEQELDICLNSNRLTLHPGKTGKSWGNHCTAILKFSSDFSLPTCWHARRNVYCSSNTWLKRTCHSQTMLQPFVWKSTKAGSEHLFAISSQRR
jgi:hypothetical protein